MTEPKSVTVGDIVLSTEKDGTPKKDKNGCTMYHLKIWLPDGVDQVVLKKDDFINFRELTEEEVDRMPEWKRDIARLKCWVKAN